LTEGVRPNLIDAYVLDTSCLMAVALRESDHETYEALLSGVTVLHLSAVSRVELGIVAQNKEVAAEVNALLDALKVNIAAFDQQQATLALAAFARYGKGRHPAALNFGDCCAYALAKSMNLPLLYKGNDFAQTDITSALA
jgi:ribonuclease VapC